LIKSEENTPKNIVKPASSYFNDLDTILKQRGSAPDLPITSLYDFNRKLWGFKKGQLYIIGSYTSHGKSSFCLQLSQDWVNQNFSVVYLSLEMPVTRCLERMLCQKYKITNTDLLTGKRDRYSNDIKSFEEDLKKWRLVITDCIGFTWQEVDSLISRLKTKPDIIILDYAQITKRLGRMQKDAYDEYIKHFREMAIRHNFCAIIVSQIGRASKDSDSKEPQLHHLQGCIHGDSLIDGRPIKEMYKAQFKIPISSFNTETKQYERIIPDQILNTGKKKCYKITTESGKTIILSEKTKLYNGDRWIMAKSIKKGNKIYVDNRHSC